jgi:DNA-binding NarL/FixJ family response regulator
MRVLLVGSPAERARLGSVLDDSFSVVGEFATLGLARAAQVGADAILLAPLGREAAIPATAAAEALTHREVQVLELLAEGLPNKAIAVRLGISDQTVKFHVASILAKLAASNRTDAVRRAVRRGLIAL